MTDKQLHTARQLKAYLSGLGVETVIDLVQERLYVFTVDIRDPELLKRVLKETHANVSHPS